MKKKNLILIPFIFCIFLFVFWQSLVGFLIQTTANRYTLNHLGSELISKGIKKEGNYWVIDHPQIDRNDVNMEAGQILMKFDFNPLKRDATLTVLVKESKIHIHEGTTDLSAVLSKVVPKSLPYWLLSLNSMCKIESGEISWVLQDEKVESADFNFSAKSSYEKRDAEFNVWLEHQLDDKNHFTLKVAQELREPFRARLSFNQVEFGKISRGFEATGHSLDGWNVANGEINGEIEVVFPEEETPYTLGQAKITDLAFDHPTRNIKGQVKEAMLDIQMEHAKGKLPTLLGKIELEKEASLSFHRHQKPFWKIDALMGGVYFGENRTVKVDLQGECSHELREFHLRVNGDAQLVKPHEALLDLAFTLSSDNQKEATVRFSAKQLGAQNHQAQIAFEQIGPEEFAFVQEAIGKYSPLWQTFRVHQGALNAEGLAKMQGLHLAELNIETVDVKNLHFELEPFDSSISIGSTTGNFSINFLDDDPIHTMNAGFAISNGQLVSVNMSGLPCCFKEVKTDLAIRNGVMQKSEMQGEFSGLKGTIVVDWMAEDDVFKLHFTGPVQKIAPFIPIHYRSHFFRVFSEDNLELIAGVAWKDDHFHVNGEMHLSEDLIAFGFELEKSSEKLWKKWPADELAASYWENVGQEVMQAVLPPIASPAVLFESNWIKAEVGIAGMMLRNGWFSAQSLALEKFLTPFLFPKQQMDLSGVGNFKGVFDQNRLAVEYEARQVVMENRFLKVVADEIAFNEKVQAAHYFDFDSKRHFGLIPLKNATYIEKNTGLEFVHTDAQVTLEGEKLHLTHVETQCNAVQFAGDIDVDFGEPDDEVFDLEIRVQRVRGSIAQAKELLSSFDTELPFLEFPVDGQIFLRDQGARFRLAVIPGDFTLEAVVKGSIQNGNIGLDEASSLQDLTLQFAYDHQNRKFGISNVQAAVYFNHEKSPYHLFGDHFRFEDFEEGRSIFDFWVSDSSRDIVRLVGRTQREFDKDKQPLVAVHIDHELTHVGNIHPSNFRLLLNNWVDVVHFQLGLDVELHPLLTDLRLLSPSGLGPVFGKFLKEIQAIRGAEGFVRTDFHYNGVTQESRYRVNGNSLMLNDYVADQLSVKGSKKGEQWSIEQLQLDQKNLSGKFSLQGDKWHIDRLRFKNSDALSISLTGDYTPSKNTLEGHVDEIEIDMAQMRGTPDIDHFVKKCSPHGRLVGSGDLNLEWGKGRTPWRVEAVLDMALSSWDMKGMHFDDVENLSCHFISDHGMTLRRFKASMVDPVLGNVYAGIQVDKMHYEFLTGEILYDDLHFQVASHHLPRFAAQLQESFSDVVKPEMAEIIRNLKLEGRVEGVLQYEMTPPYTAMRLTLKDGTYQFLNTEHQINDFTLEYDPFEFKISSGYQLGGRNVWLYTRSSSPTLNHGELIITELSPEKAFKQRPKEAIYFSWENDPSAGLSISSADGSYRGLTVELERDPTQAPSKDMMHLVGSVGIDVQQAREFFPPEMSAKLEEWKVGDGYRLKGKWRLLKNHSEDYSEKVNFFGTLEGDHFSFKGYMFDSLTAHLEYNPESIRIRDLRVQDPSGILKTDRIDILKTELNTWAFAMPKLQVTRFRPSLLQQEGMPRPTVRKSLLVQELNLEGVQGNLADSKTIVGRGSMRFTNRSKKLLQNTIFQIPSDILSRIGLDLAVLTPVTGTVQYDIHDGMIYLTKFKDIYSDGKLSKFYLPSSSTPSVVDFNGNLNVQVKMKQYNLLFKLAELVTVNIQGNLVKPTYSLQKQPGEVAGN